MRPSRNLISLPVNVSVESVRRKWNSKSFLVQILIPRRRIKQARGRMPWQLTSRVTASLINYCSEDTTSSWIKAGPNLSSNRSPISLQMVSLPKQVRTRFGRESTWTITTRIGSDTWVTCRSLPSGSYSTRRPTTSHPMAHYLLSPNFSATEFSLQNCKWALTAADENQSFKSCLKRKAERRGQRGNKRRSSS